MRRRGGLIWAIGILVVLGLILLNGDKISAWMKKGIAEREAAAALEAEQATLAGNGVELETATSTESASSVTDSCKLYLDAIGSFEWQDGDVSIVTLGVTQLDFIQSVAAECDYPKGEHIVTWYIYQQDVDGNGQIGPWSSDWLIHPERMEERGTRVKAEYPGWTLNRVQVMSSDRLLPMDFLPIPDYQATALAPATPISTPTNTPAP